MSFRRFAPAIAHDPARRRLLAALPALGVGLAGLSSAPRAQEGEGQPLVLTWPGYDAPELYQAYRDLHESLPRIETAPSVEAAERRLRADSLIDVAHPCYEQLEAWQAAGLIQGIDTARLSFWGGIFPRLRELPGVSARARTWFVPFDWGLTSIAYRRDLVNWDQPTESLSLLWDERYRGKIGLVDLAEDGWWTAAIHAGVEPDSLGAPAYREVREALAALKPQVRLFAGPQALEAALARGEIVAALTWSDSVARLSARGAPVAFADPEEGALAWCCGFVLSARSQHYAQAHEVMNALIAPAVGAKVIDRFGFGHANRLAFDRLPESRLTALGLPLRPMGSLEKAVFVGQASPELQARIRQDWADFRAL